MDNGWAALIVLLLGDPHLLEGGEGSKDGSSDPDGVFPLWGSNDLDLDGGWSKSSDFLLHTVSNTGVHGGASGHDGVGVQVLPDINITLHDGVVSGLVDSARFHTKEAWLEKSLGTPEPLVTDGDNLKDKYCYKLEDTINKSSPVRREAHKTSPSLSWKQRWPFPVQSRGRHSTASP